MADKKKRDLRDVGSYAVGKYAAPTASETKEMEAAWKDYNKGTPYADKVEKVRAEKELSDLATSVSNANKEAYLKGTERESGKQWQYKDTGGLYDMSNVPYEDRFAEKLEARLARESRSPYGAKFEPETRYAEDIFNTRPGPYEKKGYEGVYEKALARMPQAQLQSTEKKAIRERGEGIEKTYWKTTDEETERIRKEGRLPVGVAHLAGKVQGLNQWVSEQKLRYGAAKDLGIDISATTVLNEKGELVSTAQMLPEIKQKLDTKRYITAGQKLLLKRQAEDIRFRQAETKHKYSLAKVNEAAAQKEEAMAQATLMRQARMGAVTRATLEQVAANPVRFGSRNFGRDPIYMRGGIPIAYPRDGYTIRTGSVMGGGELAGMRAKIFGSSGGPIGMQLPNVMGVSGMGTGLLAPRRYPVFGQQGQSILGKLAPRRSDVVGRLSVFKRRV